jgi:hypothetical protein
MGMPLTNLKPAFYRIAEGQAVQSGWINTATGDICDTEDGDHYRIRVVPGARLAFTVGQRVEFTAPVDLYPYDVVLAGERAHVAACNEEGEVSLLLEGIHDGLEDNTLVLVPFHDAETLSSVQLFQPVARPKSCYKASPSLRWSVAIFVAVCPVAFMLAQILEHHTASIVFGIAVVCTSIVLGSSHALILALLCPLVRNLLLVPPALTFTPPTADEYVRTAVWIGMAILVPWLCEHAKRLRKVLIRWERELTEETKEVERQ